MDTIDVGGLLAGSGQRMVLDQRVRLEPFEGVGFPEPADVHLEVRATGERLEIAGTLDVRLETECYRCLGEAHGDLHVDVNERIETGEKAQADPFGESNVMSGDRLDVGDLTSQLIYSAVPLGLLCTAQCQGICPACGENRNLGVCICAPVNGNGENKWRT